MGSQVSSCVEEAAGRGGREVALPRAKAKEKEAAAAAEELAARLPGLEVLEARGCKLSRLPYEVAGLTRLVVLDLGDNRLSSLPSLTPLPRLRELRLPGNRFSAFPAVLVDLEGLEALDLSANLLPDLPRDVAKMKALRSLLLAKNAITGFPAQVCGLRNLTALDLSENKVPAVPQEVCQPSPSLIFSPVLLRLFLSFLDALVSLRERRQPGRVAELVCRWGSLGGWSSCFCAATRS
jgi:hypothetical protein